MLTEAIRSGTLTSTKGIFVKRLERRFAEMTGSGSVYACASGSAAIHAAIAAIDPEPGDEIVTTSITDMGALTTILYQSAIPVFADVDPSTLNVTADTIEPCLSERTRAIVVTHLFGNPCEMGPIMSLAARRGIPVIEDCAQAFLARSGEKFVGTIGSIGCFSSQQGKHMTTGEGGMVTSDDRELSRRMFLFINKAWGYGDAKPDHYFLSLNYRMTELQGAVAAAQVEKLESVVQNRIRAADKLTKLIQSLPGISTPKVSPGNVHVYWKYVLTVDSTALPDFWASGASVPRHATSRSPLSSARSSASNGLSAEAGFLSRLQDPRRSGTMPKSSQAHFEASTAYWCCPGMSDIQMST